MSINLLRQHKFDLFLSDVSTEKLIWLDSMCLANKESIAK